MLIASRHASSVSWASIASEAWHAGTLIGSKDLDDVAWGMKAYMVRLSQTVYDALLTGQYVKARMLFSHHPGPPDDRRPPNIFHDSRAADPDCLSQQDEAKMGHDRSG